MTTNLLNEQLDVTKSLFAILFILHFLLVVISRHNFLHLKLLRVKFTCFTITVFVAKYMAFGH